MITDKDLKEFNRYTQVELTLDTSDEVPVMAVTKSNHNEADPYHLMCIQEIVLGANENMKVSE